MNPTKRMCDLLGRTNKLQLAVLRLLTALLVIPGSAWPSQARSMGASYDTSLIATPLINQMIAATRATEEQLGLPKPALVPTPNIPPDEYTRERKRVYLRNIVQKSGHDPAKVDQILDEVYKRNAAEAGKK